MNFDEYQEKAALTAIFSDKIAVSYTALGLAGEAGEYANKIKKYLRGDIEPEDVEEYLHDLSKELGDVLWYLAACADAHGLELGQIAEENIDKLKSRMDRGKLRGNGDSR